MKVIEYDARLNFGGVSDDTKIRGEVKVPDDASDAFIKFEIIKSIIDGYEVNWRVIGRIQ